MGMLFFIGEPTLLESATLHHSCPQVLVASPPPPPPPPVVLLQVLKGYCMCDIIYHTCTLIPHVRMCEAGLSNRFHPSVSGSVSLKKIFSNRTLKHFTDVHKRTSAMKIVLYWCLSCTWLLTYSLKLLTHTFITPPPPPPQNSPVLTFLWLRSRTLERGGYKPTSRYH